MVKSDAIAKVKQIALSSTTSPTVRAQAVKFLEKHAKVENICVESATKKLVGRFSGFAPKR